MYVTFYKRPPDLPPVMFLNIRLVKTIHLSSILIATCKDGLIRRITHIPSENRININNKEAFTCKVPVSEVLEIGILTCRTSFPQEVVSMLVFINNVTFTCKVHLLEDGTL